MRTLRLARVAAQAERLRLRRLARRVAIRAGLAAVAGLFLVLALVGLHVALVVALARCMPAEHAALWVVGGDLAAALLVGVLAFRRSRPDSVERDAGVVRDQALAPLLDAVAIVRVLLRAEGLWARGSILLALLLGSTGGKRK
jgi:hypothetical protein